MTELGFNLFMLVNLVMNLYSSLPQIREYLRALSERFFCGSEFSALNPTLAKWVVQFLQEKGEGGAGGLSESTDSGESVL